MLPPNSSRQNREPHSRSKLESPSSGKSLATGALGQVLVGGLNPSEKYESQLVYEPINWVDRYIYIYTQMLHVIMVYLPTCG